MPTPQDEPIDRNLSPAAVAAVGWLLPGAGYWLLGERGRAVTVGSTIIVLFVAGLLIGGVRVLEVPGYGSHGQRINVAIYRDGRNRTVETSGDDLPEGRGIWVIRAHPLDEIRNKPWSIAQVMTGPLSIAGAAGSVAASERTGPEFTPGGPRLPAGAEVARSRQRDRRALHCGGGDAQPSGDDRRGASRVPGDAVMCILAWIPFLQPLPGAWHDSVWPFLMLPLCIAVSVVYKSIKCESMSQVPRQAAEITLWILFGMGGAAVVLAAIVKGVEMWGG